MREALFSGPGAGSLATASAVVSDLGLIARNQGSVYPRLTGMEKVGYYPDQSISSSYLDLMSSMRKESLPESPVLYLNLVSVSMKSFRKI